MFKLCGCGGILVFLGVLGNLAHYRCRDCGAEFSSQADEGEDDEEQE